MPLFFCQDNISMEFPICRLKVKELKAIAKEMGLAHKGLKKCQLILLLERNGANQEGSDAELEFSDVEIERPDEEEFYDVEIERPQKKQLRFGETKLDFIPSSKTKGRKSSGTRTTRTLTEEEINSFIPRKIRNQLEELERMSKEDINIKPVKKNNQIVKYIPKSKITDISIPQSNVNIYELLEINPNSSLKEIKSAYRKKALLYHPDRYLNLEDKNKAKKIFQNINDVLQNFLEYYIDLSNIKDYLLTKKELDFVNSLPTYTDRESNLNEMSIKILKEILMEKGIKNIKKNLKKSDLIDEILKIEKITPGRKYGEIYKKKYVKTSNKATLSEDNECAYILLEMTYYTFVPRYKDKIGTTRYESSLTLIDRYIKGELKIDDEQQQKNFNDTIEKLKDMKMKLEKLKECEKKYYPNNYKKFFGEEEDELEFSDVEIEKPFEYFKLDESIPQYFPLTNKLVRPITRPKPKPKPQLKINKQTQSVSQIKKAVEEEYEKVKKQIKENPEDYDDIMDYYIESWKDYENIKKDDRDEFMKDINKNRIEYEKVKYIFSKKDALLPKQKKQPKQQQQTKQQQPVNKIKQIVIKNKKEFDKKRARSNPSFKYIYDMLNDDGVYDTTDDIASYVVESLKEYGIIE